MSSRHQPRPGIPALGSRPYAGAIFHVVHHAGSPVITTAHVGPHDRWSLSTPWPNHPALMPPEPREAGADPYEPRLYVTVTPLPPPLQPATHRPPTRTQHAERRGSHAAVPPHRTNTTHPSPSRVPSARTTQPSLRKEIPWPTTFDDWMIDIVRRRALRLNAGARRRGVVGSVRAVELAHILEAARDEHGHWLCAICQRPVTLNDLSFDHVLALADGGEHAAHNLVPAHRKCNEEKGSERAQERAGARERWLDEWASASRSA